MRNKFNYFFHLVLHLPFAMAMFWGPFLRVCLGPRAPTWGSAAPGESKSTDPPTVEKCRPGASRKVRPRKPRVKAKSSLSGRNYFITTHHQAGVNFENFTEVKFRDILLTRTGHRDSPGQTGTYGRSNLNQNLKPQPKSNFRFIRERPFAVPSFHQKFRPPKSAAPGHCPPSWGPAWASKF